MAAASSSSSSSSRFSIDDYCASQVEADWSVFQESTRNFLERLNLPSVHPYCHPDTAPRPYNIARIPPQGPLLHNDHLETPWDIMVTVIARSVPSLAAMGDLWLRFAACVLAPLGIAYLLMLCIDRMRQVHPKPEQQKERKLDDTKRKSWILTITCLLTVASSLVLMTDNLYVLEFGHEYGLSLFCASSLLAWKTTESAPPQKGQYAQTRLGLVLLWLLAARLLVTWSEEEENGGAAASIQVLGRSGMMLSFGDAHERVKIKEGLYYDESMQEFVQDHWTDRRFQSYHLIGSSGRDDDATGTPWMPTGDARTGLPYLMIPQVSPVWTRVFLPVPDEKNGGSGGVEVIALDMSFPKSGFNESAPVYLLLHGLNGGSQESFIKQMGWEEPTTDLATSIPQATVIVMVARGLMDLPVRGWNLFHGARWSDAHQAATAVRRALAPNQVLAGIGYSMGAIILSNYVARAGKDCALDVAVSISGGLDLRAAKDAYRAQRLWQPIIAVGLFEKLLMGKFGERIRSRLSKKSFLRLMRAVHITDIDRDGVVKYNNFADLDDYYTSMSALGDIPLEEFHADALHPSRAVHQISIPLLVVHSLDDPLVPWRTVAGNHGWMHPANLTRTGSGKLMLLLTQRGGHVGWPLGWNPIPNKWKWMNGAATSFVQAYVSERASNLRTVTTETSAPTATTTTTYTQSVPEAEEATKSTTNRTESLPTVSTEAIN